MKSIKTLLLTAILAATPAAFGMSFGFDFGVRVPVVEVMNNKSDDYYINNAASCPERLIGQPYCYHGRCYTIVDAQPFSCPIRSGYGRRSVVEGANLLIERDGKYGRQTRSITVEREILEYYEPCCRPVVTMHYPVYPVYDAHFGGPFVAGALFGGLFGLAASHSH